LPFQAQFCPVYDISFSDKFLSAEYGGKLYIMWTENHKHQSTMLYNKFIFFSAGRVVCYYGSWAAYRPGDGKFEVENIDPNLCTHAIYAFVGLESNGGVRILDSWNEIEKGKYRMTQ
jgi:GH18 family chitinase